MKTLRDNEALRELFTLPPIKVSANTSLAVPEMPKESDVTGDREIDAVLWLQSIVDTGHQEYIDKALEAVKRIKTPMKDLEKRYMAMLHKSGAHAFQVVFSTMGFGDLESKAKAAIERARNKHEALARFGTADVLFSDTDAEKVCNKALSRLKATDLGFYEDWPAAKRFARRPELVPHTVSDCLHVRSYWAHLYRLRHAIYGNGDSSSECFAHECYCLSMLSKIPARDQEEALAAFDHLYESNSTESDDAQAILRNLVMSGWSVIDQQGLHEEQQA
jgi:hypothetical protein